MPRKRGRRPESATRHIAEKFGFQCEESAQGLLVYRLECRRLAGRNVPRKRGWRLEMATRRIVEKFGFRCEGSAQGLLMYRLRI